MDALDMAMPIEEQICKKATEQGIPLGATFELSPLCNMDCKMCYVKMSPKELEQKGKLKTVDQWLAYAQEARDQGLLFLLLTGGEPFLYPGFQELYRKLHELGLVISVNTNGTMLNRRTVEWLAEIPPRKLNITLYGASDETYGRLCGNSQGFSQVIQALELCQEYQIQVKINYTVTNENVDDFQGVLRVADQFGLPVTVAYYVFPANRRNYDNSTYRLTPAQAAWIRIQAEVHEMGIEKFLTKCKVLIDLEEGALKLEKPPRDSAFTCRAGSSTYWINWQGKMLLCGMTDAVEYDLETLGFETCWQNLRRDVKAACCSQKCTECVHETVCARCAASAIAETGVYEGTPEYLCELYDCYYERVRQIMDRISRN